MDDLTAMIENALPGRGLSRAEFSELIGVTPSTLERLDRTLLPPETLRKISEVLDLSHRTVLSVALASAGYLTSPNQESEGTTPESLARFIADELQSQTEAGDEWHGTHGYIDAGPYSASNTGYLNDTTMDGRFDLLSLSAKILGLLVTGLSESQIDALPAVSTTPTAQ